MACYGITEDLQDEINEWKRENAKLKEAISLLEQKLHKIDKQLEHSRKGISDCFTTMYQTKNNERL